MHLRLTVLVAVGVCPAITTPGKAQVIEYAYTGEVFSASGEPGSLYAGVEAGSSVSGVIRWDRAAAPSGVLNLLSYDMPLGFSAIDLTINAADPIGEVSVPSSENLLAQVLVADDFAEDPSAPSADSLLVIQPVENDPALGDAELLVFLSSGPTTWSDVVLPTTLDLSDWEVAVLLLESELGFVDVQLTSLTLVPEPATLGAAGWILAMAGRRRSCPRRSSGGA